MENENLYDKIKDYLGNSPDRFHIMENQIDIEVQMEYFEYSKRLKSQLETEKIINEKDNIFINELDEEYKKELLVKLACIDDVKAFRTIEKYLLNPNENLKNWASLALQESKMLLESKLLDENQVFISTGLGGKNGKLRYFIVILSKGNANLSETQKKIIKNEFDYILKKSDSEIEKLDFSDSLTTIVAIIPISVTLKDLFNAAIDECNQYGNFLKKSFIVTNVKILSMDEIINILKDQNHDD